MPNNYVLLETIALTQSATSVTFDNLPTSGYTDLKVVMSVRTDFASANDNIKLSFNGSTASFSAKRLYGSGSAAASDTLTDNTSGIVCDGATATASTFSNAELYIPNYRSSNNKSYSSDSVSETNATTTYMYLVAGLWSNSAAITSMTFTPQGGTNFVANSTFSLYGIAAYGTTPVLAPKATGGNIVANDGTYWYHAFTSSGNFVPQVGLTADVLQIAGGGGTKSTELGGGGGGAGGLVYSSAQSFANGTNYACTIGAGGTLQTSGSNTTFGALTAAVGGGKGAAETIAGATGGSGGGGAHFGFPTGYASSAAGQGNAGGNGYTQANYAVGGGGGGAGGAGVNGTLASGGGTGGAGVNTYSTWHTATNTGVSGFIAGGGGGGAYNGTQSTASGGGGAGGRNGGAATSGIANTGGGAGGAGQNGTGANGGSGLVIVRYPIN